MIYNFYIFNRKGKCLYYQEWSRPQVRATAPPPARGRREGARAACAHSLHRLTRAPPPPRA